MAADGASCRMAPLPGERHPVGGARGDGAPAGRLGRRVTVYRPDVRAWCVVPTRRMENVIGSLSAISAGSCAGQAGR